MLFNDDDPAGDYCDYCFLFFFLNPEKHLINSSTCTPGAHNLARIISKKKTRVVFRIFAIRD